MVSPARKRLASRSPEGIRHGAKSQRFEPSSEPEEGEVSMDEEDSGKKQDLGSAKSGFTGLSKAPLVMAPISLPPKPSLATTAAASAAAAKKVPFPFKKGGKKDAVVAGNSSGAGSGEGLSSSNVFERFEARAAKESHKKAAAVDHWEPTNRHDRDRSRERDRGRRSRSPGSPSTSSSYRSARHRLPAPRSPEPSSSSTFSPRDRDREREWTIRDRDRDRYSDYSSRRDDTSRHYRPPLEHDYRRDDRDWTRRDRDHSYNHSDHHGYNHQHQHRSDHDHWRPRSTSPRVSTLAPPHESLPARPVLSRQPSLPPPPPPFSEPDRHRNQDAGTGPRPPSATPPPAPPPDPRLSNLAPAPPSIPPPPPPHASSHTLPVPPISPPNPLSRQPSQLPPDHDTIKFKVKKPEAPRNVHSPLSLGLDGPTRISTTKAMDMGETLIQKPKATENGMAGSNRPPTRPALHRYPAQPPPQSQSQPRDASGPPGPSKQILPPGADPLPVVITKLRKVPKMERTPKEEMQAYGKTFTGCGRQGDYETTTKLGEGTFGEVHKAIHKKTGQIVALKRILMHNEKEGMPVTALREIKILKALKHSCIVEILDMFVVKSTEDHPLSVYMVFPYMDHDLAGLLENERVKLQPSHIKLYMKQLLEGTEYMHRNHILHRDMKAANLLISNNGSLKIADFGLARSYDFSVALCGPGGTNGANGAATADGTSTKAEVKAINALQKFSKKYTNCVVTRWYRPPELLLGARHYGGEVDIWGIGCVLGEMFTRKPILPGNSDLDQLEKIFSLCGSPNQHNWPYYDALPGCDGVIRFNHQSRRLKTTYESMGLPRETVDLMERMLVLNPRERITAREALGHEYFWTDPMPADPKSMPSYEASHEFDKRGHRHHPPHPPQQPPPNHQQPPGGHPQRPGVAPPGTNPHFNTRGSGSQQGRRGGPPHGLPPQGGPPGPPMPGYGPPGPVPGGYGPSSTTNPPPIHMGLNGPPPPMIPMNMPGMNMQLPPHPVPNGIAGGGGYMNGRSAGPPQGNHYPQGPPQFYPQPQGYGPPAGLPPPGAGGYPPLPPDGGPPLHGGRGGHGGSVNNWQRRDGGGGGRRWEGQRGREREYVPRPPPGLPSKPMAPMGAGMKERGDKRDGWEREKDTKSGEREREKGRDGKEESQSLNYG